MKQSRTQSWKHRLLVFGYVGLGLYLLTLAALNAAAFQAQQEKPPLKLNQIERLLALKFEDNLLAAEITQRGIAFRADTKTIEPLLRRGLGTQAQQALWFKEE